jgi:hypothetical protein
MERKNVDTLPQQTLQIGERGRLESRGNRERS